MNFYPAICADRLHKLLFHINSTSNVHFRICSTRLQYLHRLRNQHPVPQHLDLLRYLRIPIVITWRDLCSSFSSSIFRQSLVAYEYFQRSSLHYSSSLTTDCSISSFSDLKYFFAYFLLLSPTTEHYHKPDRI